MSELGQCLVGLGLLHFLRLFIVDDFNSPFLWQQGFVSFTAIFICNSLEALSPDCSFYNMSWLSMRLLLDLFKMQYLIIFWSKNSFNEPSLRLLIDLFVTWISSLLKVSFVHKYLYTCPFVQLEGASCFYLFIYFIIIIIFLWTCITSSSTFIRLFWVCDGVLELCSFIGWQFLIQFNDAFLAKGLCHLIY